MKNRKFCARYGYMGMGEGVGRGVLSPCVASLLLSLCGMAGPCICAPLCYD